MMMMKRTTVCCPLLVLLLQLLVVVLPALFTTPPVVVVSAFGLVGVVAPFTTRITRTTGTTCTSRTNKPILVRIAASRSGDIQDKDGDDYDTWLEQLDPSVFDEDDDDKQDYSSSSSSSGRENNYYSNNDGPRRGRSSGGGGRSPSRGGGGGGGGRFPSHDYQRDWQADDSRVDEVVVNELIAQRLQARKTGQFEVADGIRDSLLKDHGVSIFDRERIWRSGCSASGSGSKWGPKQQRNDAGRRGDGRGGNNNSGGGYNNNNDRRGGDRYNNNDNDGYGSRGRGPSRRSRPKQQNFGPNGHDYSLSSDAGPPTSPLSPDEIHDLIAQRLQFKLARNFRSADAIQSELYQNGVFVHDGMKEWRADGVGFGDYASSSSRSDNTGMRPGRQAGSRADMNRPYEMSQFSLPLISLSAAAESSAGDDDDAAKEAAKEAAQEIQSRIQELVEERLQARMDREYNTADAIREDLRRDYNVEIDDRRREWSVGGAFEKPPGPYEMSPFSLPLTSLINTDDNESDSNDDAISQLQEKIQSMIDERDEAKQGRDYDSADAIRDELTEVYNVVINDRLRAWSIGGNFEPPPEPYRMSPYSAEPTGIDVDRVNELVSERAQAREQRAYSVADDIKFDLLEDYNVVIDDKRREWSVGGIFDDNTATTSSGRGGYSRRGGGEVTEEAQAKIEQLIAERSACKYERQYGKADRIRDQLQSEFNVRLDDQNQEWHVVTNEYVQVPSAHQLDEATLAHIHEQVNQRAVLKLQRDYDRADGIRDVLMDEFSVSIDDRLKEWTVVTDRANTIDANGSLSNNGASLEDGYAADTLDTDVDPAPRDDTTMDIEGDNESESGDVESEGKSLEDLTVVQLKEHLRSRGLSVSGRKAELIERLQQ